MPTTTKPKTIDAAKLQEAVAHAVEHLITSKQNVRLPHLTVGPHKLKPAELAKEIASSVVHTAAEMGAINVIK